MCRIVEKSLLFLNGGGATEGGGEIYGQKELNILKILPILGQNRCLNWQRWAKIKEKFSFLLQF